MKPVRLGVAGAGSIALRSPLPHLSMGDLKDQVVLGAVCDPVLGRAKAAAEKFGVPESFESYEAMLKRADIDAVTICSPIGLHFDQGMKAVKAGKHVHFNKTMTTTKAEADRLIAEASRRKVKLVASPGQMLRPQNLRIRKLIQEGAIGKVAWAAIGGAFGKYHEEEGVRQGNDVLSNVNPSWYFRKPGGGPLYDITVYGLHSLTGVLGPAKRVTAISGALLKERDFRGTKVKCDADDNTFMVLDYGGGTAGFVYGAAEGWLVPSLDFPTYFGTKGTIEQVKLNGKPIEYPGWKDDKSAGITLLPHVKGKHVDMDEQHVFEDVMQLVQLIREGVPTSASPEHARHVIEIFDMAYKSAKTGRIQALTTTFTPPKGA
ncbi:MAG: Gfo/Idh/MocA family oxidoreductase [Candidatus Coatesbacteria bacterium]